MRGTRAGVARRRRTGGLGGAGRLRLVRLGQRRRRRRRRQDQRADGQQPADGRPAEADRRALHRETGIKVNFTVLPENDVRDKISQEFSSQAGQYDVASLSNFEIPIYAKQQVDRAAGRLHRRGPGVRPGRHPQADDRVAVQRGRQGLRRAVLRRVLVPDVPQGRAGREGHHDARRSRPGRRSPTSRPRSTAPQPGMARHLPARPARLGPGLRAAHHGGEHLRRHLVRRGLAGRGQRAGVHRGDRSSTSTWSASTARSARRRPGSPSA